MIARFGAVAALLLPAVAHAAATAHSGIAGDRTGPEPSDIALAVFAAVAVWFVRRALRARFRRDEPGRDPGTE